MELMNWFYRLWERLIFPLVQLIIEGVNRQYRKVTKTKSVFPSDAALEKMLYLASENVVKKWTQRYRNLAQVLNQLIVLYGERLTNYRKRRKAGMDLLQS